MCWYSIKFSINNSIKLPVAQQEGPKKVQQPNKLSYLGFLDKNKEKRKNNSKLINQLLLISTQLIG